MRKDLIYGARRQIIFRAIDRSRLMGDPFNSNSHSSRMRSETRGWLVNLWGSVRHCLQKCPRVYCRYCPRVVIQVLFYSKNFLIFVSKYFVRSGLVSHSHTTRTSHPNCSSSFMCSLSRSTLRFSFGNQ